MEENILRLLEEGGSDDIRLGYHLLKAVDQPTIPALALWKEVFRMVEESGEINLFLHHVPKFKISGKDGLIDHIEVSHSASALTWPSFCAVFDMITRSGPTGRLKIMSDEVADKPPHKIIQKMRLDSLMQEMYELSKSEPQPREYDWGPLGFPQALSDEIKNQYKYIDP